MSVQFPYWGKLLVIFILIPSSVTQGMKVKELYEDPRAFTPLPIFPPVSYQILGAEHLLLRETSQDLMGNSSLQTQRQSFLLTRIYGQPVISASYGPLSVEQTIPMDLIHTGPRIRASILTQQVRSSAPIMRVLFHAAGSGDPASEGGDQASGEQSDSGFICITASAFWETLEVRGTCSIPAEGGFCVVQLKPMPAWFSPGRGRSSREQRGETQGSIVELYYQAKPSPPGQCIPQGGTERRGPPEAQSSQDGSGSRMRRIGSVRLLRSMPGNPTFTRVRLGGAVVIQTSSKPVRTRETATFYVFLSSTSTVERFILRATIKRGMSFSTARPSDARLWDIALNPGRGSSPQTVSIICQRKAALTGKRGLVEVLQLDFVTEEFSDQSESAMITWRLELPGNVQDEGVVRIYTTQKDFVGIAPLVMLNGAELLNTAVLTGRKVSAPVRVLAVATDGSVTDITNSTRCRSTDEEVLKVSERCDAVYLSGEETRGRVGVVVNFTYSSLSAQLELSVWMPRLPLQIELSDPELSQIKGWRVPVASSRRASVDSEEEEERRARGCMLQFQHSLVRVLTAFTAQTAQTAQTAEPGASGGGVVVPTYLLGPDWQVDVTQLVRDSLRVHDPSIARLHAGTVLTGRAVGITTVQVVSPLSEAVLAERMLRVLDEKVSITELGLQLVSGLSLSLQLSPGSSRAILATTTTQEVLHSPKQEAKIGCWVQFSDGSLIPLDLFDPSSYSLTLSSLDEKVASVQNGPLPITVVAEGEGQGLLLRAELAICEACQKSKRKSKMAVGGGSVRVKLPLNILNGKGARGDGVYGSDGDEQEIEPNLSLTPPPGLVEDPSNTLASIQQNIIRELPPSYPKANLQEAVGAGISTMTALSREYTGSTGKPGRDKALVTVGRADDRNDSENGRKNVDSPLQVEVPKRKRPSVESGLMRTFAAFTDVEVGIYSLVGVSCLAIIAFVLNGVSHSLRGRSRKSPAQGHPPPDHRHHWVRLASVAEQNRAGPVATSSKPPPPAPARAMSPPAGAGQERTATLGRRSNTLPPRPNPMAGRSAMLLMVPKLARNDTLHSPTSKRNQVQFTTFTTLDIKHLAALKKNGMDLNWANQGGVCIQPEGCSQAGICSQAGSCVQGEGCTEPTGYLPEVAWPVVTPVPQV